MTGAWNISGSVSGLAYAMIVLGVADLVAVLAFLRRYRRPGAGLSTSEALRCVEVLLLLSVMAHAAEAL